MGVPLDGVIRATDENHLFSKGGFAEVRRLRIIREVCRSMRHLDGLTPNPEIHDYRPQSQHITSTLQPAKPGRIRGEKSISSAFAVWMFRISICRRPRTTLRASQFPM
jgi:hypothetical protein